MDLFSPSNNVESLTKGLNIRFAFLLSTFLLLLIISFVFLSVTISSKKHDSLVLNTAGIQRMLIRQYVSEINKALVGLASSDMEMALLQKKNADLTAKRFEETMESFVKGGEITVTSGWMEHKEKIELIDEGIIIDAISDEETRKHLSHAIEQWYELKRIALLSLRINRHKISGSPYINMLQAQTEQASTHMNHVVRIMQTESENRLKRLADVSLIIIVIGTLLFVFLVVFVSKRIVMPLGKSITTLHETAAKLKIEKESADKANTAKSEFLSCMSHELRSPMNAILGFAQMLDIDENKLTKRQAGNVKEIIYAGHHLMKLINDVLDLSRIESGNLDVFMEAVKLDSVLEQSLTLIRPISLSRQIDIKDNVSGKGYLVEADNLRLSQVLINLLTNALKYNNYNGHVTIDSELIEENRLRINITDTGDGISEDDINKLFTPFERLDKANNVEGTGIGLVICKQIVELMAGSIGVQSTPGSGSTFWIELNLITSEA